MPKAVRPQPYVIFTPTAGGRRALGIVDARTPEGAERRAMNALSQPGRTLPDLIALPLAGLVLPSDKREAERVVKKYARRGQETPRPDVLTPAPFRPYTPSLESDQAIQLQFNF